MTRFLFDTGVFVYAVGAEHAYRGPCREIVRRAGSGELRGEASVDLIQEYVHQRMRRTGDRTGALRTARAIVPLRRWHDVSLPDAPLGRELCERHEALRPRDGIFAAVALRREIPVALSPDCDFDAIEGLKRVDPLNDAAVARLAGQTPAVSNGSRSSSALPSTTIAFGSAAGTTARTRLPLAWSQGGSRRCARLHAGASLRPSRRAIRRADQRGRTNGAL